MSKSKNIEKNIIKSCELCGKLLMVDERGFGTCEKCGWIQCKYAVEHPDEFDLGNHVSFNNAKKLFKEGKPLKPTFSEYLEFLRIYGETEFEYKQKLYGTERGDDFVSLFECMPFKKLSTYGSIQEFAAKANIGGKLIIDVWDNISQISELN